MIKGENVYYARIMPNVNTFDVLELKIRGVYDTYFVGCEKHSKQAFLFDNTQLGINVFTDRQECLRVVLEAEDNYKKTNKQTNGEKYYEEY